MGKPAVLVVDDEPDIRELLTITLQRMDVEPAAVETLGEAKAALGDNGFDLCITDMRLPDGDGLELVEWMQAQAPSIPVAVLTAHGNIELAVKALKLGAFDFVSKPLDLEGLRKLVATALRLRGSTGETQSGPMLLGRSLAIEHVREMIVKVARSQAPVYICGESGTGKELVARLVHESGPRSDGPFVPVNCGAIPAELMESEFFGHRKGSFTGAVADKQGLMQTAEGGTLFLDEIAELPLHMQVKLLRAIQEKTVRPVGESREISVDVRILSATHHDLSELVRDGRFREDLYYRINVIELRVPPLRDRLEDVPMLAEAILHRLARRAQVEAPELGASALRALAAYPFPGNVRELENILERALTLRGSGSIEADDIQLRSAAGDDAADAPSGAGSAADGLDTTLEDVERQAIVRALEQTRYNKTAAAKLLGITFRALRYRIKKLGLE